MVQRSSRLAGQAPVYRVARTSTVDLIAQELRSAIYSGALPVGSPLREVEISRQLGVSRSPLREAAQRLVQEGLLTAIPGRGMHVTRIEGAAIADLYTARLAVEAEAVRLLARRVAAQGEGSLAPVQEAFEAFEQASQGEDAWAIGDADLAFHSTLVDTAGSPRLSRMMATLAVETRIASLSTADGYAVRRSISPTYGRLLGALRDGDAVRGIAALEKQFDDAVRRLRGEDDSADVVETDTDDEPQELQPLEVSDVVDG
ncbi:MAG: GntR family transcriptional regulator [Leucobacter sp.]